MFLPFTIQTPTGPYTLIVSTPEQLFALRRADFLRNLEGTIGWEEAESYPNMIQRTRATECKPRRLDKIRPSHFNRWDRGFYMHPSPVTSPSQSVIDSMVQLQEYDCTDDGGVPDGYQIVGTEDLFAGPDVRTGENAPLSSYAADTWSHDRRSIILRAMNERSFDEYTADDLREMIEQKLECKLDYTDEHGTWYFGLHSDLFADYGVDGKRMLMLDSVV